MKKHFVKFAIGSGLILFGLGLGFAVGQQPGAPVPKTPTVAQVTKLTNAMKAAGAAQVGAQTAQWEAQRANGSVLAILDEIKKEMGLDDTWSFNPQSGQFAKNPPPPPPQPAAPAAAAQPQTPVPSAAKK